MLSMLFFEIFFSYMFCWIMTACTSISVAYRVDPLYLIVAFRGLSFHVSVYDFFQINSMGHGIISQCILLLFLFFSVFRYYEEYREFFERWKERSRDHGFPAHEPKLVSFVDVVDATTHLLAHTSAPTCASTST